MHAMHKNIKRLILVNVVLVVLIISGLFYYVFYENNAGTQKHIEKPTPSEIIPSDTIPFDIIPPAIIPSDTIPSDTIDDNIVENIDMEEHVADTTFYFNE